VGQRVAVAVMDVDIDRNRISLSMKTFPGRSTKKVKSSTNPQNRQSRAQTDKQKKTPFNNPFADQLNGRSGLKTPS
jgi:uncharacterized protein